MKRLFLRIIIFSLLLQSVCSEDLGHWTVAAEKFSFKKGQPANSVTAGIGETIPKSILENLDRYFVRNIKAGEKLERTRYDLRQKRQSLYLQLSGEYQKRDALFLSYSGKKLEKKIEQQNEKIKDIEKQISDNLDKLEIAELEEMKSVEYVLEEDKRKEKKNTVASFFKKIINDEKAVVKSEEIKLYNDKSDVLFEPSGEAKRQGYESPYFNQEMCENKINSYITGVISIYGDYISVAVDVYGYPGASKIGSVNEIGSVNDLEMVASSIVTQLIPLMTNSMPVHLNFILKPDISFDSVKIYIDDVLHKTKGDSIVIDSGIHSFQIDAEGYKSLSMSYFFEGDTKYNIEVNLEEKKEGNVFIQLKNPVAGKIYTNGVLGGEIKDGKSKVVINGTEVLGEFIAEDGKTSFFYIPEKLYYDDNYVKINPKAIDRGEYIEKRRKWMYGAYSAFIASLIPTFITNGNFINQKNLYYNGNGDYNTALGWQTAANVCGGISIGLGIFWGYELIRYLLAANSVLPEKAKAGDITYIDNNDSIGDNLGNKEKEIDERVVKDKE